jgi:AcrR family transcriptional regulator
MVPPGDGEKDKRAEVLDAALRVFARYGFKKTSMDEVARAARLSRQGLYLHFDSKEALFRATVAHVLEGSLAAARAALADEGKSDGERLLGAFEAMHALTVGTLEQEHLAELLETSKQLVGGAVEDAERAFADEIARALSTAGAARAWSDVGLSARDLASCLMAMSMGLKHEVQSRAEYLKRMRVAVRLVLRTRNP